VQIAKVALVCIHSKLKGFLDIINTFSTMNVGPCIPLYPRMSRVSVRNWRRALSHAVRPKTTKKGETPITWYYITCIYKYQTNKREAWREIGSLAA
jgi:hypothetical protein